jgi:hypothetical protein
MLLQTLLCQNANVVGNCQEMAILVFYSRSNGKYIRGTCKNCPTSQRHLCAPFKRWYQILVGRILIHTIQGMMICCARGIEPLSKLIIGITFLQIDLQLIYRKYDHPPVLLKPPGEVNLRHGQQDGWRD